MRDFDKNDELVQALEAAVDRAEAMGDAHVRYSEVLRLRQELNRSIDYLLCQIIDTLDVCRDAEVDQTKISTSGHSSDI